MLHPIENLKNDVKNPVSVFLIDSSDLTEMIRAEFKLGNEWHVDLCLEASNDSWHRIIISDVYDYPEGLEAVIQDKEQYGSPARNKYYAVRAFMHELASRDIIPTGSYFIQTSW